MSVRLLSIVPGKPMYVQSGGERRCGWSEANPLLIAAGGSQTDSEPGTPQISSSLTTQPDNAANICIAVQDFRELHYALCSVHAMHANVTDIPS